MASGKFSDAAEREAFWREHVRGWSVSGDSVAGYCRAHGLSADCFHYWKRMMKRGAAASGSPGDALPAFAEVQVALEDEAAIEIAVGASCRVRVRPGFDAQTLARVVAVLERGAC